MKFKILKEETLEQAVNSAANQLGQNTTIEGDVDDLFEELDSCLKQARRAKKHNNNGWTNLLLVGLAGIGKTARLYTWGEARGVNIVAKNASSMDAGDLGGALAADMSAKRAVKLSTSELDELDDVPSVLFLDEFNRARSDIRGTFLTLIQDHWVPDASKPGGRHYLDNFLFTVAAINPSAKDLPALAREFGWEYDPEDEDAFSTGEMDDAEISRFRVKYMQADPIATANYLYDKNKKDGDIEMEDGEVDEANLFYGRAELAKKILRSPKFSFDNIRDIRMSKQQGNGLQLNPRTFEAVLNSCDGTKEDFLKQWNRSANSLRKDEIEEILANYVDKFDKANSVFQRGTNSEFITKKKSAFNRLMDSGALD